MRTRPRKSRTDHRHHLSPAITLIRRASVLMTCVLLLVLFVAAVLIALAPRVPATPAKVASLEELEAFFESLVATVDPPSISVAVVRADEVVYERSFGFADPHGAVPASPNTVYRWWSLTKLLTALAVLQLHERGRLDIDDELSRYVDLPELTIRRGGVAPPLQVKHLLNHSAAFRNLRTEVLQWTHLEGENGRASRDLAAEGLSRYSQLRTWPGRRGYYSNLGYLVLGEVIEKASGQPYESYIQEHVFDPLGMERTGFALNERMREDLAPGCHPVIDFQTLFLPALGSLDDYVGEIDGGRIWFEPFLLDANSFGGAMGSAEDATRLLRALLAGGRLDGEPVLSPETVRKFLEDGWVPAGSSSIAPYARRQAGMQHGYGWWVFPTPNGTMYEHTGAGPGYATIMRLYPESSIGIVVLANATALDREGIADRLYEVFAPSAASKLSRPSAMD